MGTVFLLLNGPDVSRYISPDAINTDAMLDHEHSGDEEQAESDEGALEGLRSTLECALDVARQNFVGGLLD